ncbi:hypothetical protein POV27_04165 [Aureisphaera galaxeae]|uniref:hypothetical protein n=1 Tax=Aureisphaera galaxeae TaxID=1538023 RepID=UPI00235087B6|nr:hypothetical protein [Aureisphaera galaxeae]MDC8003230.1 hypothetical protein [Aureisphaera galaxeae]
MEKHFDLNNSVFEEQFASATLDPKLFSHEAHLRLAWIHINKYGVKQAEENVATQLLNFVERLGERDKYNETLTVAAVKMMGHFMQRSKSESFQDFITAWPQLKSGFKGLIQSHYSIDIFTDEEAKKEYLAPDLLPFD